MLNKEGQLNHNHHHNNNNIIMELRSENTCSGSSSSRDEPPAPLDDMVSPASVPLQCLLDIERHDHPASKQQPLPSSSSSSTSNGDEVTNETKTETETSNTSQEAPQRSQPPPTPRTSRRKIPRPRKVRFSEEVSDEGRGFHQQQHFNHSSANSDDDDDIQRYYVESDLWFTPEEKDHVWWSNSETIENYKTAKSLASAYRHEKVESLNEYNQLFLLCSDKSSISFKDLPATPTAMAVMAQRTARGLERYIHPIMSTHRAKYTKTFLILQSKIPPEMSVSSKERLLCARSMQITRPSRAMARLLAHGDRLEVAYLIQRELAEGHDLPSSSTSSSTSSS